MSAHDPSFALTRLGRLATAATVLACLVLAGPVMAFAATTWSDEFPMDLTVISGNKPVIQVIAADSVSNIVSGDLSVGGFTLGTFSLQRPDPADLTRAMLVLDTSGSTGLPWGENTATATVRNALGQDSSFAWTFYTDAPPTVSGVSPAAGDVVRTTTNPLISVTVSDPDDASFTNVVLRVNSANAWGSPAYNYGYDAPTKTFSVQRKSGGWSEGSTVTVEFRCDDAAGTAARTWQFRVDTRPDTQAPTLSDPAPAPGSTTNARPTLAITATDDMPGDLAIRFTLDGVEVYSQSRPQGVTSWTPASDIALGPHDVVVEAVDAATNTRFYSWSFTASDPNSARHMTSTPFTTCSACHSPIVSTEHANRGYTCDAPCHTSTDPVITGAIDAGNTACEACHVGALTGHQVLHDGGLTDPSCDQCHEGNIAAEHGDECATCHGSADPVVIAAIAADEVVCAACHDSFPHSGGFTETGYISWADASSTAVAAGTAALDMQTPHGGYLTTTIKCQVCHSAHKAAAAGDTLLASTAAGSCYYCHGGATAITDKKISAGNRHGGSDQCTNGYCHSLSPHGAQLSDYGALKSMLLNANADPLIAAAIQSGVMSAPQTATVDYPRSVNATNPAGALDTISIYNPLVTQAMMDNADQTTNELARSVGTGYICANGGCHINGAFNALSADAFLGAVAGPDHKTTSRDTAIKGHVLGALVSDVAYAPTARCNSCHDSVDARIGGAKQFPHGNDNVDSGGNLVSYNGRTATSAWFTLADKFGGTYVNTNSRVPTSTGGYTVAMDGACLKCHRNTDDTGVGSTY
jgi:predicted CXXCH cytochrome family protein